MTTRSSSAAHRLMAVVAAFGATAMLAAACGSDDGDASATTTTEGSGGASGDPVKMAFLWEIPGESDFAVPDFENGANLAVEEINAAGGVNGHPIETVRFSSPPIDAEKLTTEFLRALEEDPDIILGFPGGAVEGLTRQIDEAGIPIIRQNINDNLNLDGPSGSEWMFGPYSTNASSAIAAVRYAVEELGAEKLAVVYTDESFGQDGAEAIEAAADDLGVEITVSRGHAPDATDLTEQVLATEGADAVIAWTFPGPLTVFLDQMKQNGIDLPVISHVSAPLVVNLELASADVTSNLYGSVSCNPPSDTSEAAQEFSQKYEDAYGQLPTAQSAVAYDSVYMAAQATTGSTDPDDVKAALETLEYDGICSDAYASDDVNIMSHKNDIISFADGKQEQVASYDSDGE